MKFTKALSLTALIALSSTACSTLMDSSNTAPVDTMSVNAAPTTAPVPGTTVQPPSTTVASSSSTSAGGSLGSSLGKSMDGSDNARVNQALESQKTGQTVTWTNSGSNTTYTLTPTRTFSSPTGEPCRDFTVSALISGQTQQVYGTACRDTNAQWHVISS